MSQKKKGEEYSYSDITENTSSSAKILPKIEMINQHNIIIQMLVTHPQQYNL